MVAKVMMILGVSLLFGLWASLFVLAEQQQQQQGQECQQSGGDQAENNGACDNPLLSWVDEMGDKTMLFLQEKVFGQKQVEATDSGFLTHIAQDLHGKHQDEHESKDKDTTSPYLSLLDRLMTGGYLTNDGQQKKTSAGDDKPPNDVILAALLDSARQTGQADVIAGLDFLTLLSDSFNQVVQQLTNTFADFLGGIDYIPLAMIYYLGMEDARKNPTWKRRQHLMYDRVSKPLVLELHDALYASQLTYVDTLKDFRKGLEKFRNNTWELVSGTVESLPDTPAHFLIVHKHLSPLQGSTLQSLLPWEKKKDDEIQLALLVRGTKHLSDALADGLLEPQEYRGGYAHGGILKSGLSLFKKHLPTLKKLLEVSKRKKIRLFLVGHSLGAGAAAIAAMEFNEYDFITVEMVGFGCPSLLSQNLSLSTKKYITTVVSDADIVPRMSGSSMVNVLMDVIEYDWTDGILEDAEHTLQRARDVLPTLVGDFLPKVETAGKWLQEFLDKEVRPKMGKKRDRLESVLIPPGNCIHLYRDGVGYTGSFTPCDFFSSIDVSRTMIDDHLIMPGYHKALINMIRDWDQNHTFDFVHDIASIPC
jgi:hypothetical protein